jgi:hypothetical protein
LGRLVSVAGLVGALLLVLVRGRGATDAATGLIGAVLPAAALDVALASEELTELVTHWCRGDHQCQQQARSQLPDGDQAHLHDVEIIRRVVPDCQEVGC